jgi:hypothetical protein
MRLTQAGPADTARLPRANLKYSPGSGVENPMPRSLLFSKFNHQPSANISSTFTRSSASKTGPPRRVSLPSMTPMVTIGHFSSARENGVSLEELITRQSVRELARLSNRFSHELVSATTSLTWRCKCSCLTPRSCSPWSRALRKLFARRWECSLPWLKALSFVR